MKKPKKNNLFNTKIAISVFFSGAAVMVYELVGSRILAPYVGSSIYIWTSLIGVILGSLSLGYWLGGKLSDKNPSISYYPLLFIISGLLILCAIIIKDQVLNILLRTNFSVEFRGLIAAILIFAPPSIILGMISPYAAKLKLNELKKSGSTVGNLYAISTLGSILGTFAAGFYLIPTLGSTKILYLTIFILWLNSLLFIRSLKIKLFILLFLIIVNVFFLPYLKVSKFVFDIDTRYSRFLGYIGKDFKSGKEALFLADDFSSVQSAMFLKDDELVFDYAKYYRLANLINPDLKKALMIGGGAYSYPKDFIAKNKRAKIDVVEIDPGVTDIARKYFRLVDNPRLNTYNVDGRVYLNTCNEKYGTVLIDAFKSNSTIPFQLTTKEAVEKISNSLNENGIVIVNIISSLSGNKSKFLQAELKTYQKVFPFVHLYQVRQVKKTDTQNIVLVGLKGENDIPKRSKSSELNSLLKTEVEIKTQTEIPLLTDEFAPVEYYGKNSI